MPTNREQRRKRRQQKTPPVSQQKTSAQETSVKTQQGVIHEKTKRLAQKRPVVTIFGIDYEIYSFTKKNFIDIINSILNRDTGELELGDFNELSNTAQIIANQIIPTVGPDIIDVSPRDKNTFLFTIQDTSRQLLFIVSVAVAYYKFFATEEEKAEINIDLEALVEELEAAIEEYA